MLQIGSLLDNKYKILNEIGRGGMSFVYLAINERANKTWAVKEIRKTGVFDFETVMQGLAAETDMLKKLKHPNLPSIIDVLDYEDSFIIVMDYIEGVSLQNLLTSEGPQPEEKVMKWGRQLCDVLRYLHRQDPPIIYRDMKPANVMLRPEGNIALIDFGIAREFKNREMIEDTICLGTRGYAAPEQFGGRGQTDARTDIYCLGATLYHLLTGHSPALPPYGIKPISFWIPCYQGSGLEKVLLKCTQQDPEARYQNCEELMYALHHYRDEDDINMKHRQKLWRRFLAGIIIGCIGFAGALGFHRAERNAGKNTYHAYVQYAEGTESLKSAQEYLMKALEIDAGASEAYQVMMTKADNDIIANNGTLSSETAILINELLKSTSSGIGTNADAFKSQDPEAYTRLMYDLGITYFFMKDNTAENKKFASENYFADIQDERYSNYLNENQKHISELLYKIGNYISSVATEVNKYRDDMSEGGTYQALFQDYSSIISGHLKEAVGKDIYCIRIYEQIASEILKDYDRYLSDGISVDKLRDLAEKIKDGINSLNVNIDNDVYSDWETAKKTVETTIDTIARIKSRT